MGKKILIADDEEEIIELLKCALEAAGYEISSAMHGGKLPAILESQKPDLLILDVLLPGIDGYSLILQLSQDSKTSSIPVVVLTALPASKPLFEKFSQVKAFYTKPFEPKELVEKIDSLFR